MPEATVPASGSTPDALPRLTVAEREKVGRETRRFFDEVDDATLMLSYAVSTGTGPNDRTLPDELVDAIEAAQDAIRTNAFPPADVRSKFEKAYRDLAKFLSPVTAATLKATSDAHPVRTPVSLIWPRPVAIVWSRKLSAWTLLFVAIALLGNWFNTAYGPPPDGKQAAGTTPDFWTGIRFLLEILVPFTYGAIGACISLLKACQAYIHMRQFDPLRIPEYYNRMILGAVSGGVIVLLVHQVAGPDGTAIKFSADALGFVAGYNSDLLFSAVERISEALLPKVGIDSVRPAQPRHSDGGRVDIHDVSLKDLLDRLKAATTDDEKKLYTGLIRNIQGRIA